MVSLRGLIQMFRQAFPAPFSYRSPSPSPPPPGIYTGLFSSDLAPEGNFQQAQADMLAHIIGDVENMLNAAIELQDPEKKVDLHITFF